jgi:hypothetical protein
MKKLVSALRHSVKFNFSLMFLGGAGLQRILFYI